MNQTLVHREPQYKYRLPTQRNLPLDDDFQETELSSDSEKWQSRLLNAKISWDKLTDQELIKSRGSAKKLAALVQQRYALSNRDAEKQVNAFLNKNAIGNINQNQEQSYEDVIV